MRNKITLLVVVTLVYECHSGLIKDVLSRHHLSLIPGSLGSHGNKRQSVNQGDPGTVILVVKEAEPGYGKPGYGGHGGPGHHHQGSGHNYQHHYDQGQENFDHNHKPGYGGHGQYPHNKPGYGGHDQYPHNKPGYGGHDQYPQNKPGYGGNQHNPEAPPYYGNDRPNYNGGHRPGYGGPRPGYGGHRPGHGHHSLESDSSSNSAESSEEFFGNEFRPPYHQGGGAFNHNQPNGNYRPGFNNPNGPVQPGSNSGQFGNNNGNYNRPSLNQVKPVYETPNGQPSIEGPPVQQPNINQQPGNGQFNNEPNYGSNKPNQGGNRPNPAFNSNANIPIKPQDPEGAPLLVPLDPTVEFNQHGGPSNEPKRETKEKPKPADDDEEYSINVRYGDK